MKRYAMVRGLSITPDKVAAYLPANYTVEGSAVVKEPCGDEPVVVIGGRDRGSFTLDSYVIPRLGSGLLRADEIDLSHPVMRQIDA